MRSLKMNPGASWRRFFEQMKTRLLLIPFLIAGFLWVNHYNLCYAQKQPKNLTILFTNNINGEIDPCPT